MNWLVFRILLSVVMAILVKTCRASSLPAILAFLCQPGSLCAKPFLRPSSYHRLYHWLLISPFPERNSLGV